MTFNQRNIAGRGQQASGTFSILAPAVGALDNDTASFIDERRCSFVHFLITANAIRKSMI
jgi:hypothetical protein